MAVIFSEADRIFSWKGKRALKAFLVNVLAAKEGFLVESLGYVFCSDDFLLEINRTYLQHDDYTDIITFDLGSGKPGVVNGEIYISLDRVRENATMLGISFRDEVLRVIFHGILHLCGYKDKSAAEQKAMRQKESYYLDLFKVL